jgi:heme/copper-type cytochrome/quinol oxidase subunit 2
VSTIVHLLLAVVLTLFLAVQAQSFVVVLRHRQARAARRSRRSDLVWSSIPIVIVLARAARSGLAAFDVERPAVASAVAQSDAGRPGPDVLNRPSR